MLLDNVAVLCVPMGTCKILPPQLYKVEILTKSFDFFYVCSAQALSNESQRNRQISCKNNAKFS